MSVGLKQICCLYILTLSMKSYATGQGFGMAPDSKPESKTDGGFLIQKRDLKRAKQ